MVKRCVDVYMHVYIDIVSGKFLFVIFCCIAYNKKIST